MKRIICLFVFLVSVIAYSQQAPQTSETDNMNDQLTYRLDMLQKSIDDVLWFDRVGDVAFIDKVYIVGPPRTNVKNPNYLHNLYINCKLLSLGVIISLHSCGEINKSKVYISSHLLLPSL